jgi:ABC-type Fe3+ transport system permease subunit
MGSYQNNYNAISVSSDQRGSMSRALLVNTPQIIITFCYVFYNSILTGMLLEAEHSGFTHARQALRVSHPTGAQKKTYWLQLPCIYSIPTMAGIAVLHFLVGRSLYLVDVRIFNEFSEFDQSNSHSAYGYSLLPAFFALCLGGLMTIALVAVSLRKLKPGMPSGASCSLVISAACYPNHGDEDAALKPLMYSIDTDREDDEGGHGHAAFSSREVAPLKDGVVHS